MRSFIFSNENFNELPKIYHSKTADHASFDDFAGSSAEKVEFVPSLDSRTLGPILGAEEHDLRWPGPFLEEPRRTEP